MSDNENIVNNSEFNIRIIPIQQLQDISTQDIQLGDFYLPVGIKDEQDQTFEKSTRKISFIDLQEILHTIPNVDQFPTVGNDHNGLMSQQDKIKLDSIQTPIINNIPLVSTGTEEQEYQDATNGLMSINDKEKLDSITGIFTEEDKNELNRLKTIKSSDINNWNSKGTVHSIRIQAETPLFSSDSEEKTNSLNTTISFTEVQPRTVLVGPIGENAAKPSFSQLTVDYLPSIDIDAKTTGNLSWNRVEKPEISANQIYTSPINMEGETTTPVWRSLVEADLPLIDIGTKTIGNLSWGRIIEPELQQSSQVYISPSNIEEGSTASPEWRKITKEDLPIYENEFRVITASFNYSIRSKKQKDGNVNITIPNNYICLGICGYNLANYFIFPSRLQYVYNSSNGPQISYDFFNAHDSKTLSGTATIQLICIKKTI